MDVVIPIADIDTNAPNVEDHVIEQILYGLLRPSQQTSWLMARELKEWRTKSSSKERQ